MTRYDRLLKPILMTIQFGHQKSLQAIQDLSSQQRQGSRGQEDFSMKNMLQRFLGWCRSLAGFKSIRLYCFGSLGVDG